MIFWIFVILTIVAFIGLCVVESIQWNYPNEKEHPILSMIDRHGDGIEITCISLGVIGAIVTACMLIAIICQYASGSGFVAENEQRYESLLYKSQTESIRDEFGIVNKSYIDDVQDWNEEVAKNKAYSQSKWVDIFYPEKYYGCWETIDLNKIKMKE